MTLYLYTPDRAALLDGIVELVLDELVTRRPAGPADQLRRGAHNFCQLALAHPHMVHLTAPARCPRRFDGPLFDDFETSCRGPVEFDLAYVPEAACEHHPRVNHELLDACRPLVLAMVAAWRWRLGDEFPNRRRWGQEFLRFAARRTALANTRHDDPATRRPIEIRLDVNRGLRKATHQGSADGFSPQRPGSGADRALPAGRLAAGRPSRP